MLAFFLMSNTAWATTCFCDVFAVHPLRASRETDDVNLGTLRASYYGDLKAESIKDCRKECRLLVMGDERAELEAKLITWTNQLARTELQGDNCTGLTDSKIPVRVRARIGDANLGLAHQTIFFLHRKQCY